MIKLSLINGTDIMLNSDLIELIEETPDTIISLSNGKKVIVRNSVQEVIDKIMEFRRVIGVSAKQLVAEVRPNDEVI